MPDLKALNDIHIVYLTLAPTRSSALLHYGIFHAIASYLVCMFFFL